MSRHESIKLRLAVVNFQSILTIMFEPFILEPVPTAYQPMGAPPPLADMVMFILFSEGL